MLFWLKPLTPLFPPFTRTCPTPASLFIVFYYSRRIPRNDHIIGERATPNASSTNHDVFPNVVPFNIMELAPRKQPSPITRGAFSEDQAAPQDTTHYKVSDEKTSFSALFSMLLNHSIVYIKSGFSHLPNTHSYTFIVFLATDGAEKRLTMHSRLFLPSS